MNARIHSAAFSQLVAIPLDHTHVAVNLDTLVSRHKAVLHSYGLRTVYLLSTLDCTCQEIVALRKIAENLAWSIRLGCP